MSTHIVLLRGVNVGGHHRLPMAELRAVLERVGCANVVTHLQSGQAVVDLEDSTRLAERIEAALREHAGLTVRVLTRTAAELAAVVAANPYPERANTPKQLHVVFLETAPDAARLAAVGTRHGDDEFTVGVGVLYVSYQGRSIDSPLNAALRRLGGVQTARNWTTVTALLDLATRHHRT